MRILKQKGENTNDSRGIGRERDLAHNKVGSHSLCDRYQKATLW